MRHADDWYATPAWAIDAMLSHLPLGGAILEPSAGDGAIVRALLRSGVDASSITALELNAERSAQVPGGARTADFFDQSLGAFDLVITNPPYRAAQRFVERSLELAGERGTVAMLLRLGFLESRARAGLHRDRPSDLYVLSQRPSFTADGRVDATAYGWFVWGPGRGGRWQILDAAKPARAAARAMRAA